MFLTSNFCAVFLISVVVRYAEPEPCPDVPKLRILPGIGWDALADKDTEQLLELTYDECELTDDGRFLIPDGMVAVSVGEQEIRLSAEILEHWSNYTGLTSARFKLEPTDRYAPIYYSFSDGYKEMKTLQVKLGAVTFRSEIRRVLYRINSTSDAMTVAVKERLLDVIRALVRDNTGHARYLAEMIVRDWGTHYSKSVDVGVAFVKEDYLNEAFFKAYDDNGHRNKMLSASKLSLLEYSGVSWRPDHDLDSSLLGEYKDAVLDKKIAYFGEQNWKEGARPEIVVAVDRSGQVLDRLLSSSNFPRAPSLILVKARQMISKVSRDYYRRNTHRGCTQPKSVKFDFTANSDNGSCNSPPEYSFGGVFMACEEQFSSGYKDGGGCKRYHVANPVTGDFSCPKSKYFKREAHFCRLYFSTDEKDTFFVTNAEFVSCMSRYPFGTSYQFGGLYSHDVVNIHTKNASCPPFFTAVRVLWDELTICISNADNDSAKRYALPFGGFASCANEYECPIGYKKHLAYRYTNNRIGILSYTLKQISFVCGSGNIYYCLQEPNVKMMEVLPPLVRSPFENSSDCSV